MSIEGKTQNQNSVEQPSRRRVLKTAAAAAGTAALAAPFIRNAAAAETTVWKIQTSWPAGIGLQTFKTWCGTIKEKTGGELEFKPFAAKEVVGDFELLDGVKNGVLEAMNSFTLYWAGKLPATAFLSSYLMGLRFPHEWDIFFYSKDGLKVAREIFAKQGLYYVNRIHHGPNIIHSKKPIRTIEDFKDLKLRVPGGMIAEGFAAAGAKTTLLPGGEVFSALEKGTVEAADYTGPAVNWDLGFQQVSKYIWTGPPGLESIYQPVDLMDFVVRTDVHNKLSPKMKVWLDDEVQVYSNIHHAALALLERPRLLPFDCRLSAFAAAQESSRHPANAVHRVSLLAAHGIPWDPSLLPQERVGLRVHPGVPRGRVLHEPGAGGARRNVANVLLDAADANRGR